MGAQDELVKVLVGYINQQWKMLEESNLADSKQSMLDFIDYCDELEITGGQNLKAVECLINMKRIVERVLEVDMRKASNRKGEIPLALGLVDRKQNYIRDYVIYLAYDHARYGTGEPGRSYGECDEAVKLALEKAKGIDLDHENIRKIYQRMWEV